MSEIDLIVRRVLEADDEDMKDVFTDSSKEERERHQYEIKRERRALDFSRAANPQTSPEELSQLLHSGDWQVKMEAVKNPSTPLLDILDILPIDGVNWRQLPRRVQVASGAARIAYFKRVARAELGASNGTPVKILLNSRQPPAWVGQSYGWESPGGVEWRSNGPPGWPYYKTYAYRSSDRHIVVGSGWLYDQDELN